MPKRTSSTSARPPSAAHRTTSRATRLEVVDPRWVLKALGVTIAFALLCAYLTVCVLFYVQQWQLVLTPSRAISHTPADAGMAFAEVHFDNDSSGSPQLDGWWIPSDTPSGPTALMLHAGAGSISDAIGAAHSLHGAHLNVLLFDYRGFGHSIGKHPREDRMEADSDTALNYLLNVRHIPLAQIVLYGAGVGGSLAVRLARKHSEIPALILDSPDGDLKERIRRDARATMVPAWLLFTQNFALKVPLRALATKTLVLTSPIATPPLEFVTMSESGPDEKFELRDDRATTEAIRRFLDKCLQTTAAPVAPSP